MSTLVFSPLPSLWPAIHRLATGESWPPSSDESAARFVARATRESLLPLLASERNQPENVRQATKAMSAMLRANAVRTQMISEALQITTSLLDGEQLILLKGSDFAYRLYERPDLRPMGDIDILVREGHLDRLSRVMISRGFRREYPAGPASRLASHHEATFRVGQVTVELHHRFVQKPRHEIDYEAIWRRAVPMSVGEIRAFRLSDVDAFVYQTISIGLKYFLSPLIRVLDLWLLRAGTRDLTNLGAWLAGEWKAKHVYYAALRYAGSEFPEFRDEETERVLAGLLSRRRRVLLDGLLPPQTAMLKSRPSRAGQLWQKFWLMDDMGRRMAFAASHAAASIAGRFVA